MESVISFIGGGVANFAAIEHLLAQVKDNSFVAKALDIKLNVFDIRSSNFWGGDAYKKNSPSMYFNQRFEFLIDNNHSDLVVRFNKWAHNNIDEWIGFLKETKDHGINEWLAEHEDRICNSKDYLLSLKLPRMLFGHFLDGEYLKLQAKAARLGVKLNLLEADVADIEHLADGRSRVVFSQPAELLATTRQNGKVIYNKTGEMIGSLVADEVAICIGLPPAKELPQLSGQENYYSSHLDAVGKLKSQLLDIYTGNGGNRVEIGIWGGRTSMEDTTHLLSDPEIADKVNVTIYSTSGRLPVSYYKTQRFDAYKPKYITPGMQFHNAAEINAAFSMETTHAIINGFDEKAALHSLEKWQHYSGPGNAYDAVTAIAEIAFQVRHGLEVKGIKATLEPCHFQAEGKKIIIDNGKSRRKHDILINCSGPANILGHRLMKNLHGSGQLEIFTHFNRNLPMLDFRLQARPWLYLGGATIARRMVEGSAKEELPNIGAAVSEGESIGSSIFTNLLAKARLAGKGNCAAVAA